jgi:hypothetical protein
MRFDACSPHGNRRPATDALGSICGLVDGMADDPMHGNHL